jgi:5-methylcytosine-specific restriction endonuclease McrA
MNNLYLPQDLNFVPKEINSDKDFLSIICPEHGLYYKEMTEVKRGNTECPRCQFLNPSRMFDILEEARKTINEELKYSEGNFWLDFFEKNKHQPEIFETNALYYRILVTHKATGFMFEKIGILSNFDEKTEGNLLEDFNKLWSLWKWKAFKIEVIDKIECNLLEAHTIEELYQNKNHLNKITVPNELGFNINKTYLPHFMWQAKSKTIKPLRDALLLKQKGKCTICGKPAKDPTLDHMHQKKVKGTGRIRGAVCSMCNTFLARSENNAARHGISNKELPDILRNMADYLEDQKRIIHPTEVPKRKKVGVREWNRVKKYYFKVFPNRKTLPKKPTYITDSWLELKRQVDEYIEEEKRLKATKKRKNDRQ